jgi:glutaredoxin
MSGVYVVYGADNCKYCKETRDLLNSRGVEYVYRDITLVKTETMDRLASQTGNQRTVPLIFKNNIFIGGYTQLENELMYITITDDF